MCRRTRKHEKIVFTWQLVCAPVFLKSVVDGYNLLNSYTFVKREVQGKTYIKIIRKWPLHSQKKETCTLATKGGLVSFCYFTTIFLTSFYKWTFFFLWVQWQFQLNPFSSALPTKAGECHKFNRETQTYHSPWNSVTRHARLIAYINSGIVRIEFWNLNVIALRILCRGK